MQFLEEHIRGDIIQELLTNYSSDLDQERWSKVIQTEVHQFFETYDITMFGTYERVPYKFLEIFVKKYSGKEFTVKHLSSDEELNKCFQINHSLTDAYKLRAKKDINFTKCMARIWSEGYGSQCNRSPLEGNCLCKTHQKSFDSNGSWWLGMINEDRPENPVHPSGKGGSKDGIHFWK